MLIVNSFFFPHKTASVFAGELLVACNKKRHNRVFSTAMKPRNQDEYFEFLDQLDGSADAIIFRGPERDFVLKDKEKRIISDYSHLKFNMVFQLRDMLDIAVSQFFSHGWIHPDKNFSENTLLVKGKIQRGEITLPEYVRLALFGGASFGGRAIVKKFQGCEELLQYSRERSNVNALKVTYEDMVLNYDHWIEALYDFSLSDSGLSLSHFKKMKPDYSRQKKLNDAGRPFYCDVFEYVEEAKLGKGNHIRSAYPGDYQRFLSSDEISGFRAKLRERLPFYESIYE